MSIHRYSAKRDANEPEIIAALRGVGAVVTPISAKDVCDLLVLFRSETYLLEVKVPKGTIKPGQLAFIKVWTEAGGKASVVRSPEEALRFVGAIS